MKDVCKLCNKEKKLLKKSHIIPDFLYKSLYDNKHRINTFDIHSKEETKRPKRLPTGVYEKNILCSECDNEIIGKYESYGAKLFQKHEPELKCENIINNKGKEFKKVNNIDYTKTKLFLISLLWRIGISKREIYNDVILGKYEEQLRKQIISNTPGTDYNIPIIILSWFNDGKMAKDIITQPNRYYDSKCDLTIYSLTISGYIILYYLTDDLTVLGNIKYFRLQENNTISIIYLTKGTGWDFILANAGFPK